MIGVIASQPISNQNLRILILQGLLQLAPPSVLEFKKSKSS